MIKLMPITDMGKFNRTIQKCRGSVLLHLPDNTCCDLKEDHTAAQLLQMVTFEANEINIQLSNPQDFTFFLQYMLEAYAPRTCAHA